jgi:hypothetical protein
MDHPLKYIRATQRWKAKNRNSEAENRPDDSPIEGEQTNQTESSDSDEKITVS